jgi:hypothetical protein
MQGQEKSGSKKKEGGARFMATINASLSFFFW